MRKVRYLLVVTVLLISAVNAPTASANCQGVMCGGYCGVEGFDFCIYVWGGNETIGCKKVDGAGCMSMGTLICCPRDPIG
jgi:hypothetical protein